MKNIVICFSFFYCIIFLAGCNADSKTEVVALNDTAKKEKFITTEAKIDTDSVIVFTNIEQIEYCLPLPLNEYIEDFDKSDTRAKHVFKHKTKKDNEMELQGFFRDDVTVSIEDYFKNTYQYAEEEGKIITKKEIVKDNNCFYAKGYWANLIYDMRFIEIVWLKKDEMVKFYSSFDVKDSLIWDTRLQTLLNSSSNCN